MRRWSHDAIDADGDHRARASYAFVKAGAFALDLRIDLNAGLDTVFGTLGLGVNVN